VAQSHGADLLGKIERVATDDRAVGLGAADELGRTARTVTGRAAAVAFEARLVFVSVKRS
jgi:hypothetical protein